MMLKYFLTRWLEKISGFALVFVKTFQMSVGHDDEIVVGQIPLEKGCRGEGTWISSWALDEVAPSIEAFGSVTVKYCGAQIIFQFCYIWSLSFFFPNVTGIILWKSSSFMYCGKKYVYFLALLPFLMLILKTSKSWVRVFCFGLFEKTISKKA